MKARHITSSLLVVLIIILISSIPVLAIPMAPVIIDQANFCNKPAVNPGDPAYSEMFDGQAVWGWGCQFVHGNILADRFTLTTTAKLTTVELFAFQIGSTTTSTFDGAYVAIYDGDPSNGGTIIWGDMTTNRFNNTSFTGCYRVSFGSTATDYPIMRVVANCDAELTAGTYWLAYQLNGSLSSGPWGVPSVLETIDTAGTGLQYIGGDSIWIIPADYDTDVQPSFPFLLRGIAKGNQNAPAAPVVASKTDISITLETVSGAEYKRDSGDWQASPTFSGLLPYTEYTFYCRLSETETMEVSPSSTGTPARTDKSTVAAPAAPIVAGKTDVTITLQTVAGAEYKRGSGDWQTSPAFTGLSPYTEYTFFARLSETATLAASPSSTGTLARTDKSTVAAPAAPVVESKTDVTITLQTVAGAEYRRDGGSWQSGPEFSGLAPNTEYRFEIRLAETSTAYASPASPAITGRTNKTTITAIPSTPALLSVTANTVTLVTVDGAEYRANDGAWQASPIFSNLLPNTTYTFTMRLTETEIALASPSSEILYSITLQQENLGDLPQTGEQAPLLPLLIMTLLMAAIVSLRIRLARKKN